MGTRWVHYLDVLAGPAAGSRPRRARTDGYRSRAAEIAGCSPGRRNWQISTTGAHQVVFRHQRSRSAPEPGSRPPAWYPDPAGNGQRYWDGEHWTGYRLGLPRQSDPGSTRRARDGAAGGRSARGGFARNGFARNGFPRNGYFRGRLPWGRLVSDLLQHGGPGYDHVERGRPALLWNRRIQAGYDVTIGCALAAAAFTVIGSVSALARLTSLAAIAQSATHAIKPGLLNLLGPIIILLALPGHHGGVRATASQHDDRPAAATPPGPAGPGRPPVLIEAISPRMLTRRGLRWNLTEGIDSEDVVRFGFRGAYYARLLLTAAGWIGGVVVLIVSLASLGDGYTVSSGAFLLGMLELAGLIAVLTMLPTRLERARVIGQPTQRSAWASRIGPR